MKQPLHQRLGAGSFLPSPPCNAETRTAGAARRGRAAATAATPTRRSGAAGPRHPPAGASLAPVSSGRPPATRPIPCSAPAVVRQAGARRTTPMTIASTPAQPTPETRTAMLVLVALSVCHLLNDTIQSLLPALYPLLEANYALSFTQIGMIHLVFQVHRLAAAAAGRPRHRPAADVPAVDDRHGREPGRPRPARLRRTTTGACCSPPPASASARRSSTPNSSPGRPHRLGRPLRLRAVAVPGRRQHRHRDRPAARRLRRAAARPAERRALHGAGARRDGPALERRHLGPRPAPGQPRRRQGGGRRGRCRCRAAG